MSIANLEPKLLWKHFDEIRKIPHGSGNESQLREYVLAFAKQRGLEAEADGAGNAVIRVPATPGHEKAPPLVLQGHMDMVCEKDSDVQHDFTKDPIQLQLDGDWLTAKGTTLGSDNGIGLAASLAVAESEDTVHGPLELLFTVDEEVGLTGAGKLSPDFVKGRRLLNLDSEELGALYIGCSGGGDSTIRLPVGLTSTPGGTRAYAVKVTGLRGGHSGIDIHEQRGNAIKILARVLWKASRSTSLRLGGLNGGNKRNAIPREAEATLVVSTADMEKINKVIRNETDDLKVELGGRESELTVQMVPAERAPEKAMDEVSTEKVLNLLLAIPHGVEAMSYDIAGLVETSTNLATVATEGAEVVLGTSSRSSIGSALQAVRDRIRSGASLAGAIVEENDPYPGWKPNLESELLSLTRRVHNRLFGEEPELKAIHAGLECGIIGEKFPGMDMVSFGPQIEHPHSPEERVNIPSVEKFWELLRAVIEELA